VVGLESFVSDHITAEARVYKSKVIQHPQFTFAGATAENKSSRASRLTVVHFSRGQQNQRGLSAQNVFAKAKPGVKPVELGNFPAVRKLLQVMLPIPG